MLFNRHACAQPLGKTGLYLFAVSGTLSQGGMYAGLGLMLLGLLLVADEAWPTLRREPAFPVALILTAYIVLRGVAATANLPAEPPREFLRGTWDLVVIGGLFTLVVSWWLNGDAGRIARVLQLALIGLFLGVLKGIDWSHFTTYMGQRPLFGMGNGAGLYALVTLAGLVILGSSSLFDSGWQQGKLPPAISRLVVLLLFLVFTAVFLLSQTRAAWLAALLVMPAVIFLKLRCNAGSRQRKWVTGFEVAVLALFILGISLGAGTIEKRLGAEQGSLVLLLSGDAGDLPSDAVGLRVQLWENALQRIAERPLLGWGAGSAPVLIHQTALPATLSHYHNLYLQLTVELGLTGLGLFALWSLLVVQAAVRARREGRTGFDFLLFLLAVMAIFLITSCFQIRHDDERGQCLLVLLGALALTHRMCRPLQEKTVQAPVDAG
jgi:O-antigen ligase